MLDLALSASKTRRFDVRLIGTGVAAITAILAALVFLLGVEDATPVLQFWLAGVVVVSYGAIISAKVVRQGRRWYGIDWYLAMGSSFLLVIFLILGIMPEYIAPYGYDEEVAPKFLSPGETPPDFILILREDFPFRSFEDVGNQVVVNEDGTYSLGEATERASQANSLGRISADAGVVLGNERETLGLENAIAVSRDLDVGETTAEEAIDALLASDIEDSRPLVGIVAIDEDFASVLNETEGLIVIDNIGPDFPTTFLGTNNLGYDVFSRLIYGSRTTLITGITSALFSCIVGIPLGLISGYVGGSLDRFFSLILDSLYSFPGLILAIAIAVVLGRGIFTVIFAISVIYVPVYYRIVRSQTLAIREVAYVEAAKSLGETNINILFRYIFPNIIASIVVIFSINVADAILTGAGLSFLSLGLPETTPDWGVDLARNQEYLRTQTWLVALPGLMITVLVLCFSLLGESLSEILNPRLNRS